MLLPNLSTSQARIKVKGSNHVFFDISNGNFTIEPGIVGCVEPDACNFDPTATVAGTCSYPDPGTNCDGESLCLEDLNSNGAIDVGDVLLVLSEFGCVSGCTADSSGDGFVTVEDILAVLSVFGQTCN